jgi:threonine/homoserine/homoserine lactone efflux protein
MSMWSTLPAFLATVYLLAIVPGQGMALILRQAIIGGTSAALWSVVGNNSGLILWGSASAIGLASVFSAFPLAYAALKWSGVAFLVFLAAHTALQLRNASGKFELHSGPIHETPVKAFRIGLITNLTNVKAAVFAVAFLPSFVPHGFPIGEGIFILGIVWSIASMSWYLFLILLVNRASTYLERPIVRRVLTAVSSVGLAALAVGLVVS